MPANLDNLPFDILHSIACYLEIRDYTHLSRVCKKFDVLLQNDSTARSCLQVWNFLSNAIAVCTDSTTTAKHRKQETRTANWPALGENHVSKSCGTSLLKQRGPTHCTALLGFDYSLWNRLYVQQWSFVLPQQRSHSFTRYPRLLADRGLYRHY
jgi:hypothetical protein